MAGAVEVAEVDGLLQTVHYLDGQNIIAVLGVPVLFCCRNDSIAQNGPDRLVPPNLHALYVQAGLDERQELLSHSPVDQQALHGVADRRAGALGIVGDRAGHIQIGGLVHIGVAHALTGADHRHLGIGGDGTDQAPPAPGDEYIQVCCQIHQLVGALPAGVLYQRNGVFWKTGRLQSIPHDLGQGLIGAKCLLAAPEDDGVAGLETKGSGVCRHIGPGLVDNADDTQRHPAAADPQAVGTDCFRDGGADGIGEGGYLADAVGNAADALLRQAEPVLHADGHAVCLGGGEVGGVGGKDIGGMGQKGIGNGGQRLIFQLSSGHGKGLGGGFGGLAL